MYFISVMGIFRIYISLFFLFMYMWHYFLIIPSILFPFCLNNKIPNVLALQNKDHIVQPLLQLGVAKEFEWKLILSFQEMSLKGEHTLLQAFLSFCRLKCGTVIGAKQPTWTMKHRASHLGWWINEIDIWILDDCGATLSGWPAALWAAYMCQKRNTFLSFKLLLFGSFVTHSQS